MTEDTCKCIDCNTYFQSPGLTTCSWCSTGMTAVKYQQLCTERKMAQEAAIMAQIRSVGIAEMGITAAEAKERLDQMKPYTYKEIHKVCSKVIDYWNIADQQLGGVANCYYAGSVPLTIDEFHEQYKIRRGYHVFSMSMN